MSQERKSRRRFFQDRASLQPGAFVSQRVNGKPQPNVPTGNVAPSAIPGGSMFATVFLDPKTATKDNPNGIQVSTNMPTMMVVRLLADGIGRAMLFLEAGGETKMDAELHDAIRAKRQQPQGGLRPSQTGLVTPDGRPALIDEPETPKYPGEVPPTVPPLVHVQPPPILLGDGGEQPQPIMAPAHPETDDDGSD